MTLPPATVLGIGAVTPLGRDLKMIAEKLAQPPELPGPVLRVSDDDLASPTLNRQLRRADRFVRMAAVAAMDACAGLPMDNVGLVVTSGFGSHCRGFKFLDGILDCGDSAALPTDFSHSVHGAAASYIAGLLDLRGPTLTTTDFEIGFEQAVLLAQCWLDQKICNRVLVGAAEELGDVLIHCASYMLNRHEQNSLGEGAVFLALGSSESNGMAHLDAAALPKEVDLLISDDPSITPNRTTTFTPYFGRSASSSAFQILGALLTLPTGTFDSAATQRTLFDGSAASLLLTRIKKPCQTP